MDPLDLRNVAARQAMEQQAKTRFYDQGFTLFMHMCKDKTLVTDQEIADVAQEAIRRVNIYHQVVHLIESNKR